MSEPELSTEALLSAAREGVAAPAAVDAPAADRWMDRVRVRLYRDGALIGSADSADTERTAAVRMAAAAAALEGEVSDPAGSGLHIETVATLETIAPEGLSGLLQAVEPGRDGLALHDGETSVGSWPADARSQEGRTTAWVKGLLNRVRPRGARLASSTRVERFTTLETAGPILPGEVDGAATAAPRLVGAIRHVPEAAVTRDVLIEAALRAASWLVRHQLPDGRFRYEFRPDQQDWSLQDHVVRQAGCAWALAALARAAPTTGLSQPAKKAIEGLVASGLRRDGPGRLHYVVGRDGVARLGAIPLLLLAVVDLNEAVKAPKDTGDRLVATMLATQRSDGGFGTSARGMELEGSETYYAGQIALALGRWYAWRPQPRQAQAWRSALGYYSDVWQREPEARDLSFVTWMLQACEVWHVQTDDQAAADYGFAMADWALESQHGPEHPNPLWSGAYQNTPGIGTAAYTEGIARALLLARRVGDAEREARYLESLRGAARFLLQLTVDEADGPMFGPPEQRGAVRSALHRRSLRCDNAQHFIMAATQAALLAYAAEGDGNKATGMAESPADEV